MTKIGIMTFLHNDNYGSTLQAWALQKCLRDMGYEAEDIDYLPGTAEKIKNMLTSGNSPWLILDGFRKRAVRRREAGARDKSRAFPDFYASQMRL